MKTKSASQSAFLNLRLLIGFAFCSIGASLALSGLGVFSAAPPLPSKDKQIPEALAEVQALQPWSIVANYPSIIETPAVGSNGTYAYSAGGFSGGATNNIYRYDPAANSWATLAVMPTAVYATRGAYAANTNSFYVFGGYTGVTVLSTVQVYHVATNSWTLGAPMPGPRTLANVVYDSATGKIYVVGGFTTSFVETNTTWEYDPVTNTWDTTRTNIPVNMVGSAASMVGQFIYLAGSYGSGSGSTLHYRYDVNNDLWAPMPGVPVPVYLPAGAAIGSQIYVIGGGNPSEPGDGKRRPLEIAATRAPMTSYDTTYVFDSVALTWTTGPTTNVAHSFTGGTAIGNRLLVVGGYNGTADTNTVELALAPPQGRKILLLHADCGTNPVTLRNNLLALDPTLTVDFFNAQAGTPTLGQLEAYDIVVPFSNCIYSDPVTLGNNLVSYMNSGGVVVAFNFDWFGGNQSIQGAWLTDGSPFNNPGSSNFSAGTLGVFTAGHPLMLGVSTLNAFYRETVTLATNATQVAAWNDGSPMIAFKGRAVGVSGYVGDFSGMWSGDFARVILNAGNWLSSPGHHILLLQADCGTNPVTLRNNILALEPTTTVDFFNGATGTPTVAQLQEYDTVVPFSNCDWSNSTTLGNNLVSYMNKGGVVVAFNFDWSSFGNSSIQGTWLSGGYTPFNFPAPNLFSNGTLGLFSAGHPLMEGVSSLNAFFRSMATVAGGATQVAAWNDSIPLVAFKGRAVGVSGYVGDNSGMFSGDFARVILNAGNWLGSSDLFVSLNGQVTIGNGGGSILEFTSAAGLSTFVNSVSRPRGLAFDAAGNLFVASTTFDGGSGTFQSSILKVTPVGVQSTFATLSGNFFAEDLKFDTAGNLFVLANDQGDPNFATTIYKFTPSGTQSFFGSVPGQSFGLAFDGAGNLYASDNVDQTIYKFTPGGVRTVHIAPAAFGPSGLQNGDFETGSFAPGWTIMNSSPAPVVSTLQANSGTHSGHVGSFPPGETAGDSSFFQQVTVPATGGTLIYWYWPRTLDMISFDWQDAYITNAAGTAILATVMHVCQNTQDWTQVTFDLAAFAGQTVGIKFLVHGDGAGGDPTDMFVDDVFVSSIGPVGLAFDKSGNLFVSTVSASTTGIDTILRFTPTLVQSTFATGLTSPRGLAFDHMGNLFVAEVPQFSTGDILKFTPAGARSTFASALGRPAGNGGPEFLTFRPVVPLSAVSRKVHGGAGTFDIPLPLTGTPGIECRTGGVTNDYQIVISFAHLVTVGGATQAQVTSGTGTVGSGGVANGGAVTVNGSTVTVPLTNIGNAQTITVTLFGVNDGSASGNVVIPMSRLLGDTNGNGSVSSADVSQTKSRIGQVLSTANFRSDVNANGIINASDTSSVKSSIGTGLP